MDLLNLARDISDKDIENLKNYKYTAGEYTKLDNLMNNFWLWAVELLPQTLAPNMVTIYAFISGVLPAVLIVFYDATFQSQYPALLHVLAAVGIFLYQTLDALDGKQARRINAKSPLGQLFDHGCDSFSTAAFMIHSLSCLRTPWAGLNLFIYAGAIATVYASNICEHFTGVLNTSVAGQLGVTEVQFVQIFAHLVAAVGGFEWTHYSVGGVEISVVVGIFVALGEFASAGSMLKSTLEQCKNKTHEIWTSLVPIGYIIVMLGLFGSLMVCKVIVATLCKQKINPLQVEMIVVSFIPLAITFVSSITVKKELIVFFFLISLLHSGIYAYQTVQRIATFLKIKILTV